MKGKQLEAVIFDKFISFKEKALAVFQYQYDQVAVYNEFCNLLNVHPGTVQNLTDIPFLPIETFKYHQILTKERGVETIFRSSGTTGQLKSQHFVSDLELYERSILNGFEMIYGAVEEYCILGLLPSYLERKDASLVHMVDFLMTKSAHKNNGFYLENYEQLQRTLRQLIQEKQKVILIGVTFALLDFAEQFPMDLSSVVVVETGGMKGRRKELTRNQLHLVLNQSFQTPMIHSEYGMTELLSQAYWLERGVFQPSSTMSVLVREVNDPFHYLDNGKTGALNIIDLSNIYSCSFIATQDLGKKFEDGCFTVLGRVDYSDLRGCNLMIE